VSKTSLPKYNPRRNDNRHARLKLEELQLRFSYRLRLAALSVATFVIMSGVGMAFLGLQGSTDVRVHAVGTIHAKLVNAPPGIVFAVIGVVLCCVILSQGPPPSMSTESIVSS
jgi:hypothetical protein